MRGVLKWINFSVLPRGWRDLLRQIVLFVGAFVLYGLVRGLVDGGNLYKPFGDAMQIIDLERTLHIFVEPSVQAWAQNKRWLMDAADWTYLNGHFFVTFAALAFVYFRRNRSFYFVRNVLMISMALALVGYWLYPTAPPRLLPEWGFTDSISQFVAGTGSHWDNTPAGAFANAYAAVPSMHVCFAVIIGSTMARLATHRLVKIVWFTYPALVTFVVVATANHFLVDVFLGALTAGISFALAHRLLARARPDVWAFGHATA
ncbi:MAG: phosphatase PAP2 family protein [Solirubrobacterales bacterium]|nr:phosphatase PAP2 family protein [Solirubrobacterales bacterium]